MMSLLLGHNADCSRQNTLRDCLIVTDAHSDINSPSPASCYGLVPGTGCRPGPVKHVKCTWKYSHPCARDYPPPCVIIW